MKLYYPENLDLTKFLPQEKLKHIEKYYYVISQLYVSKTFNSRYHKDSYIRLKNNYLRKMVNSRWANPIKTDLENWRIIEIQPALKGKLHSYKVGRNSKGYRLTAKYRNRGFNSVDASEKLKKLRDKHYFEDITGDDERLPIEDRVDIALETYRNKTDAKAYKYRGLKAYMKELTIDFPAAMKYIDGVKDDIGQDKYNSYRIAIDYIADSLIYLKTDPRTGRLYTNITNLYKHLRPFLRYQGQELVQVDIANSQPFFFNFLLPEMWPHKGIETDNNNDNMRGKREKKKKRRISATPDYSDIESYRARTQSGKFYDHLLAELNRSKGTNYTREEFKPTAFGKIFFCKRESNFHYKESKIFKEIYPNVFKVILREKLHDHRELALKLQRAEAEIMIEKIAIPLAEEIPIFTIHDSIMTTPQHLARVTKFIQKTFAEELGIVPTLK